MSTTATVREVARATALLNRFKLRELSRFPLSLEQPVKDGVLVPRLRNPFLPSPLSEDTNSGRRDGPKYSLRRQKELIKAAKLVGSSILEGTPLHDPDASKFLPRGPKSVTKVYGGGALRALNSMRNGDQIAKIAGLTAPADASTTSKTTTLSLQEREVIWVGKPKQRSGKGIYEGRRVPFKTHIWEREKPFLEAAKKKHLAAMSGRIGEWRNRRAGRTVGTKLPF